MKAAIKIHLDTAIREREIFNLAVKPEQIFSGDYADVIVQKLDEYAELFDQLILNGVQKGEFSVSQKKMARMIILGAANWIQVWYSPEGEFSKEEIEQVYADYLLKILT